ncbi:hypothetical protein EI94DRAFT_322641 [Lactarius quietus]|nr:hypothetical protein EI94DRAFT_322641 [Lactarius quietus]
MEWTYDADESLPFPPSTASCVPAPAVCQTTHPHRPSRRALEAAEADTETEAANALARAKRKATTDPNPTRRVTRKVDVDKLDSNSDSKVKVDTAADDPGDSDDDATTEPGTEPADNDYEVLKAMGDADHQALTFKSREERTADIHLIFHHEKGYAHPDSGKILDGHWCTVCLTSYSLTPYT